MGHEIFTSFKDLFENTNAIFNIGVGYSDKEPNSIRIEAKEYFYTNDIILKLYIDEIKSDFTIRINDNDIFRKVECGYQEIRNNEFKYLEAFNVSRSYNLPQKINTKTLSIKSKFITEGTSIEVQRNNINNKEAAYDKDIIAVCVGNCSEVVPVNPNITKNMWEVETGILNPFIHPNTTNAVLRYQGQMFDYNAVYNFRISPYYNLIRWLNYLGISFYKVENNIISFAKGELNYEVGGSIIGSDDLTGNPNDKCSEDYSGGIPYSHNERNDIDISSANGVFHKRWRDTNTPNVKKVLYSPEIVEFQHSINAQDFLLIKENPNGIIMVNDIPYYLSELNFKFNGISKFKLIKVYDVNK